MNKIILIQPYFGKFPNYFQLHLLSIAKNPNVKWLFFTDDRENYDFPSNTNVFYLSFDQMKNKIQEKFDFKIKLDKPYKLCDFKLAYGYIFNEYIKDYQFWGHCDVDVLYGDIERLLTPDVLENYDIIFRTGHFRLYRNEEKINLFFKNPKLQFGYKKIFSSNESYTFDEANSTQRELLHSGFRYYDNDNLEADLDPFKDGIKLRCVYNDAKRRKKYQSFRTIKNYENQIFAYDNGKIFRYYIEDDEIKKDEFINIHFLKRKMNILGDFNSNIEKILITPNKFILNSEKNITKDEIKILSIEKNNAKPNMPNFFRKINRVFSFSFKQKIIVFRQKFYDFLIFLNLK